MKILYLSFDPGISYWGTKGASIHIREFTRALREAGHTVTTIVTRLGEAARKEKRVHELPGSDADFFRAEVSGSSPALLAEAKAFARNFTLKKTLKKLPAARFDLVYERYSLFGVAGRSWAREAKVPFVLEVNAPLMEEERKHRTLILEPLALAIRKYLFSGADHLIAVSQAVQAHILSVAPEAPVTVLPNGVDVRAFTRAGSANGLRKKLGGREKFLVGFVGSLKPWHGLEFLLAAFRLLSTEGEFGLVIVGEGPLRQQLEKNVRTFGLQDQVTFTGAVGFEQIPKTLKALDALVAPYPRMDGFYFSPLKIFEYMAAGRPIVASRIGQVAEILQDGTTALLVPPEDPEALAAALRQLAVDRKLGARLGREAQRTARAKHTWQARLEVVEPIFRALASRKK